MALGAHKETPREEAASAAIAVCRFLMTREMNDADAIMMGGGEAPAKWEDTGMDPAQEGDNQIARYSRHEMIVEVQLRRGILPEQLKAAMIESYLLNDIHSTHDVTLEPSRLSPTRATISLKRRGSAKIHPIDAQSFVRLLQAMLVNLPELGYVYSFVYREAGQRS